MTAEVEVDNGGVIDSETINILFLYRERRYWDLSYKNRDMDTSSTPQNTTVWSLVVTTPIKNMAFTSTHNIGLCAQIEKAVCWRSKLTENVPVICIDSLLNNPMTATVHIVNTVTSELKQRDRKYRTTGCYRQKIYSHWTGCSLQGKGPAGKIGGVGVTEIKQWL